MCVCLPEHTHVCTRVLEEEEKEKKSLEHSKEGATAMGSNTRLSIPKG